MLLLPVVLLIIGLVLLIAGAEYLVRGASSMARKWGISSIVIGLTIVAFGTSAPEMVVNILSSVKGATGLAVGNVVGSNLANILLILGIGATVKTLKVKEGTTYKEIPFALLAIAMVAVLGNDTFFDGIPFNGLGRIDGIIFLAFFIIFLYYTYGISKVEGEHEEVSTYPTSTAVSMFILGLAGLIIGGKLIVDSAITIAIAAGLSEALIGLTIIAVGTSLPELATTIVALRKGHTDLAIGNAIGSNIFNVFWVLGLSAIIRPLPFDTNGNIDVLFTTFATLVLFISMFIRKKHTLGRHEGIFFILLYVGYIVYAIMR
ncbi:MAG: sodium:proton exchanger [Candidatus Magasanikbacteria bacterium CG10_big_fil_rev_8_21_14_0_10_43_6]|uniref:Sodium:proton exchanger n=1 Tax=Candidatus Magasanikbacteria bacterium CG10_big_fil_rev_8_21_14_0_10_43_6 TaxID=1974650 RepID=A0A2M6W0V8_9BACT|nr:MAG: sodium:proton exchanger [Candidatus Magasanikbacteria bacterium CG10_big_fil_rev_8_21_14_0_10_43_6]